MAARIVHQVNSRRAARSNLSTVAIYIMVFLFGILVAHAAGQYTHDRSDSIKENYSQGKS